MHSLVTTSRRDIQRICERHGVLRLELFGSAGKGEFNEQSSDLDFLIEFKDPGSSAYADAYFGVLEELSELFHRPVDLVVLSRIKNPYFLESVNQSRELLYAA